MYTHLIWYNYGIILTFGLSIKMIYFIKLLLNKYKLALDTLPLLAMILISKLIIHTYGFEFLELNSLFTAIISANIFIIGFLISSILSDYKESEKLPADLTSNLESLLCDSEYLVKFKSNPNAIKIKSEIILFINNILKWKEKEYRTNQLLMDLNKLSNEIHHFEESIQANYVVRLKNEISNIRKIILRIDTIRDTSFNSAGYAITEIISPLLVFGLIFVNYNPYYESIFFVIFVCFVLIYMNLFIRELDNPFDTNKKTDIISFKPIEDLLSRFDRD